MKKNFFSYKRIKDKYLLTNDLGRYIFLTQEQFDRMMADQLSEEEVITQKLKEEFFLFDSSDYDFVEKAGMAYREYRRNLFQGAALHIFVLTRQCNQQCVYCQASANMDKSTKMSVETAQKAVDIALQTPARYITIEFQGGEPLLNFETLKFIVEYTNANKGEKNVEFSLVSNLMLLDDEKMNYLMEHNVMICTSLDGDETLHNRNRPYFQQNPFQILEKRLEKLKANGVSVSAIQTTTRYSLSQYKKMVDKYLALGLNQITIRPLTPLGYAEQNWEEIGYTVEEFLQFYRNVLEYIRKCLKTWRSAKRQFSCYNAYIIV